MRVIIQKHYKIIFCCVREPFFGVPLKPAYEKLKYDLLMKFSLIGLIYSFISQSFLAV